MVTKKTAKAECISPDALQHLKSYKYQAVDKSFVSRYILKHYWEFCANFLPRWLAPNAVTLIGFGFIISNVALLTIMIPDLVSPTEPWVYFSFAFGMWAYSTMDNLDGKQARKTGTSSPLGELFDHGIDSLNCTLASCLNVGAVGLGCSWQGVFTALIPCLPMWFSTWETYHTHVLYLGYFNGPTEGLIIACAIIVASGIWGPQIWSQPVAQLLGNEWLFKDYTGIDLWVPTIGGAFLFAHFPLCVINVVRARRAANLPVAPVFLEWAPIITFSVSCVAWLFSPGSHLLANNHLVLFCITLSFVFGRMTTKIILAHLTKQPFPMWTNLLVPLVLGATIANLPRVGLPSLSADAELWFLRGYFVFAVTIYARWAHLVIGAMCEFLGIRCLHIPYDKDVRPRTPAGFSGVQVTSPKRGGLKSA
ncbi:Choline/ethanolaminephosphotransferase [Ascobolus immersus RN42]|uniref:Choline/ethanolaminephosphotransferase n=1 Tax=Ascobolus immersus RN42 TaxID=1160509 RepID=A0A3N4IYV9_ASCIM|nr:Choline/ethanolaminephosphotransferase [Ascobolus immersus RN42]